jgi:hypothetical protein
VTRWFVLLAVLLLTGSARGDDRERIISETCALISQQRNSLSDAVAVSEAKRKLAQERIEQWEFYFRSYTGEAKS